MAQSFWLECANFARVGDQSARPAVEAARQDLRGFAQLSPVERIGQELSGEWANLAHLIGSLAICSVNNQAEYWEHSWPLLTTGPDDVRIVWITNLSSGLESVCMPPESFKILLDGLPDDQRHLMVHCLLAASALLAQVCCATPATQPFTVFTTWVEYARILKSVPSPVDLNIPSASALHLLLHWLRGTSPFPKFLQTSIIPATASAVSNAQARIFQAEQDHAGAREVSGQPQRGDPSGDPCGDQPTTDHGQEGNPVDHIEVEPFNHVVQIVVVVLESCLSLAGFPDTVGSTSNTDARDDDGFRLPQKASKSSQHAEQLAAQHRDWCSCMVMMWRNVLDCLVSDPGDVVGSLLCVFFVETFSNYQSLLEPDSASNPAGSDVSQRPLPHALMSSLIHVQREALTAAASHVYTCCQSDMPPTVASVRRVLPLCALAMPALQAGPCGLSLLADAAASERSASALTHTPIAHTKGVNSSWMALSSPAASMMGSTPTNIHSITTHSYRVVDEPVGSLAGSCCFPAEPPRFQCQSTTEACATSMDSNDQWEYPVLQAVMEAVMASVHRCEELQDEIEDTESGLVQYTSESLRAQRLLCAALSVAPYALLPARQVVQGLVIDVIAKLFAAGITELQEEPHATMPGFTALVNSQSPENQACDMHPSWNSSTRSQQPAGECDSPGTSVGLVACSRVVRHALRHNFASLMAAVLYAIADDTHTAGEIAVDVTASESIQADALQDLSHAAAGGVAAQGSSMLQRVARPQGCQGRHGSKTAPMTLVCAVAQGLQVAVKHLCRYGSSVPETVLLPPVPHSAQRLKENNHAGAAMQCIPIADSESSRAGALRDVAAANVTPQHLPNFMSVGPPVHTPAALKQGHKDCPHATSPKHKSITDGPCPSMSPPVSATPGVQAAEAATSPSLSRAFVYLNHALIDCIENVFDAAQTRWAEEDPGVLAATPMNARQRAQAHMKLTSVPEEVESVLALCGSLWEEPEQVTSHMLLARESAWTTSLCVESVAPANRPADHGCMSPLLQLHSPLSPFVCYGPNKACGSTVTLVHVMPLAALNTVLDAAMTLPVRALPGVDPAAYVRRIASSRAQLHKASCSFVRAAQRMLHTPTAPLSPLTAVQAIAAAKSAMHCASVAMEACNRTLSVAHSQASLSALQVIPQAIHTLFDVSWRCPDAQAQLSIQSTMSELLQSSSQAEKYSRLAVAACDWLMDVEYAGVEQTPGSLHVTMFAVSALTACSVASVTGMRECRGAHSGVPGPAIHSETTSRSFKDKISGNQAFIVITVALQCVMSVLKWPGLSSRARMKQSSVADPTPAHSSSNTVTMQQLRAWLTVLLQLCLEAAASALEDATADVTANSTEQLNELNSILEEVANYLTSAKQRENVSSLLWFAMFPGKPSTTLRAVGRAAATYPSAGAAVVVLMLALAARKCDCPNGKRGVTWDRAHEVVRSTQLSKLWPLPTSDARPAAGNSTAPASRRAAAAAQSVSRKRKICASEVLDRGDSTTSGLGATAPAPSFKAPKPVQVAGGAQRSRVHAVTGSNTSAVAAARNSGAHGTAGNLGATPCVPAGSTLEPSIQKPMGAQRTKLRSGDKWLQACMSMVGAAVALNRSHTVAQAHGVMGAARASCTWKTGLDDVHKMLESAQGLAESSVSLMRLSSTLIRIQAACTGASEPAPSGPSKSGLEAPSADANRITSTCVLQAEQPAARVGASEDTQPGKRVPKKADAPSASGKSAAARPSGSADGSHLQPAAIVSALATFTSIEVMCDADGTPSGNGRDTGCIQPPLHPSINAKPGSNVESVLLHIGLVFAPAVTPVAAAAASCMHLLAFSRRYAGIGYPAITAYLPVWAESACMSAIPKCMHDSIRTGKSLVRARLSSATNSAAPDIRPLWVLSELLRRCSEATSSIVAHITAEGEMATELEAPFMPNFSPVKPSVRCPSQSQNQQQGIQELVLCLVCLAATQAGLAICDAEAMYSDASVSSGNDTITSGGARYAMTCVSAAAAGSHAPVDTPTVDVTGGGGSGCARDLAAKAAHAQMLREVLRLCRSHLEHILWALANGMELAVSQVFAMFSNHKEHGMASTPGHTRPASGAQLLCEIRSLNTNAAKPPFHAPPTLPRNQTSARSSLWDSSPLNGKAAASTPLLQPAETPSSPRYSLRSSRATTPQLPHVATQTPSHPPPVPRFYDSPVRSPAAAAAEDLGARMSSKSKPTKANQKQRPPAAGASKERMKCLSELLAGHFEQSERQNADLEAQSLIPPVPHASAVAAMRLIATFNCAQCVISRQITQLKPDVPNKKTAHAPLRPSEGVPPPQRVSNGAFAAHCTPTAAATSPCDTVPVVPSHPGSGHGLQSHHTLTPHLCSNAAPRNTPGSMPDATANVLFATAIRTPGSHAAEPSAEAPVHAHRLQAYVAHTERLQADLIVHLGKLAKGQGSTANAKHNLDSNWPRDQSPAIADSAQQRRATIAAELLQTLHITEGDVLSFLEAPEASAAISEASEAAEEDTACGAAQSDESSDRDAAKPADNHFVEPDDPRDLEKDVQWMNTRREQTENDPRAREALLHLLELAGGGATAIKGVDAELADVIKEYVEAVSDDDEDGECCEDTDEASDEEDNDNAEEADEDAREDLEDNCDSDGAGSDVDSSSYGSDSGSGDSHEQDEESESGELVQEQVQHSEGAKRRDIRRTTDTAGAPGACSEAPAHSKAVGKGRAPKHSMGKSEVAGSKQGVEVSSATVDRIKSREVRSDSDLPRRMQSVSRSYMQRPKASNFTRNSGLKSQSKSSSRKSRSAHVERIGNSWLKAAVENGEGSVDDALALADFVVAQPERDYDELLRNRYWSQNEPA